MAAVRGASATLDGHDPEAASLSNTGGTCVAEWVTGGSTRRHIQENSLVGMHEMTVIVFSPSQQTLRVY